MTTISRPLFLWAALALIAGCAAPPSEPAAAPAPPPAKAPPEETAPAVYRIDFETTRGPFVVEVVRAQAPHGADRLYSLVRAKYFDGARFFRVVPGFMVQWGLAADPAVSRAWNHPIPDDPVKVTNARGTLTFAASSRPGSRTTQVFINFADNSNLDAMGFAPVGRVVSGMDHVDQIYSGYGEEPDQGRIMEEGNAYLQREFPDLDAITSARIAE